nr:hypothetical protein [Methanobrevibacter arboriphilus]
MKICKDCLNMKQNKTPPYTLTCKIHGLNILNVINCDDFSPRYKYNISGGSN